MLCNGCVTGSVHFICFRVSNLGQMMRRSPLCQHMEARWTACIHCRRSPHSTAVLGTAEVTNQKLPIIFAVKGQQVSKHQVLNDFQFRFLFTSSKFWNVPSMVITKTFQNSSGRQESVYSDKAAHIQLQ